MYNTVKRREALQIEQDNFLKGRFYRNAGKVILAAITFIIGYLLLL